MMIRKAAGTTFFRTLAVCLCAAMIGLGMTGDVAAESRRNDPIGNFFRSLFGVPQPRLPRREPEREAPSTPSAPRAPAVTIAPKAEDARVVRVFGDSLAGGLQDGLSEAFAEVPDIVVDGSSKASSGLVRYDFYNWADKIKAEVGAEGVRTDAAVIMIGLNDRQDFRDGEKPDLFTDKWREAYKARIEELTTFLTARGIRVYWVGLPPMNSSKLTRDFAVLNEIYRETTAIYGAVFVDVWTPFLDQDSGEYSAYGPDVSGTRRRLRNGDGIHFTRAGNRKLAFFVERDLRRDLLRNGYLATLPGDTGMQEADRILKELETGVGHVVALTGRPPAEAALAGAEGAEPALRDDTNYRKVILKGEPQPALPGRSDDFAWPPQQRSGLDEGTRSTAAADASAATQQQ